MAGRSKTMRQLEAKLAEIQEQIKILQANEALLLDMIRTEKGEPAPVHKRRAPRAGAKRAVLAMLGDVGAEGLNAVKALQIAEKRGESLDRGTVSSLLSRLKSDGVVTYDGSVYRLKEFSNEEQSAERPAAQVHPLRASGASS